MADQEHDPGRAPLIGSEEAAVAEERREATNAQAVYDAILAIQATRKLEGYIDCPACKGVCALRFRQELRRGRGRARMILQAKCTTPKCLEFLT